jgi:hypothetical protein
MANAHDHHFEGAEGNFISEEPIVGQGLAAANVDVARYLYDA